MWNVDVFNRFSSFPHSSQIAGWFSRKCNGIRPSGTCILPTKTKATQTVEGSLTTLPRYPTERPRGLALTFQRANTTEKGLSKVCTDTGTWVSGGSVGGCSVPIYYVDDIFAAVRVWSRLHGLLSFFLLLLLLSLFRRSWNSWFSLTLVLPANPDSWEYQEFTACCCCTRQAFDFGLVFEKKIHSALTGGIV